MGLDGLNGVCEHLRQAIDVHALRQRVAGERIAEIVSILRTRPQLSLAELLEHEKSRLVIIVTFLAILELWKHARIAVAQTSLFSPIVLERGERWEDTNQIPVEDAY